MTATEARWPQAPDDIRTLTDNDAFDAAIEATVFAACLDFASTTGRTDGTRSEQVRRWAAELERVGGRSA